MEQPPTPQSNVPESINPAGTNSESNKVAFPDELVRTEDNIRKGNNRAYVFTDWDSTRRWEDIDWTAVDARYAVGQFELAPTTGERHLQGYVELNNARRFVALKKVWPGGGARVWFAPRKGTQSQAREYCMKDETRAPSTDLVPSGPFEFGTFVDNDDAKQKRGRSGNPKSNPKDDDAQLVKKWMLEDGLTRLEVVQKKPRFANEQRFLMLDCESIVTASQKKKAKTATKRTKVVAIQGEPGTGKSSTIRELVRAEDMYTVAPGNTGFCCGFANEGTILFEEVDEKTLPLGNFKALADATGDAVLKRKHRDAIPFNSELLVLITNESFLDVWPNLKTNKNDLEAVRRRVDLWCKYTKALKPFTGFTSIRFRFQNVENPTDPLVEWLGLFYPMHGSVTFEDCILTCLNQGGLLKCLVNDVKEWVGLTMAVLRASIESQGTINSFIKGLIDSTPQNVKNLQSSYEYSEEVFREEARPYFETGSVYAPDYDLIPKAEIIASPRSISNGMRNNVSNCPLKIVKSLYTSGLTDYEKFRDDLHEQCHSQPNPVSSEHEYFTDEDEFN